MLLVIEADRVENGLHAFADVVELAFGNVLDTADIAPAEVVDHSVEAVAGIAALGGVDLVARFGTDAAVLIVAVGEGNAGDLCCRDRMRGMGDGLCGTLIGGDVWSDAVVEESSGKGGVGMGIKADGGDGAHLSSVRGVARVETEGADVAIAAGDIPCWRDGEGHSVAGIVEGTRRWRVRLRGRRLALKKGGNRFGLAGDWFGLSLILGVRADRCCGAEECQQSYRGAGQNLGESHTSLFCWRYWPRMRGLATV